MIQWRQRHTRWLDIYIQRLDSQAPCKGARIRINFDEIGTLWAPSRHRYMSYKLYDCIWTCTCLPGGIEVRYSELELGRPTGGRNSFLVSSRTDECVSLVVTCLGNITKIRLLPRYTNVVVRNSARTRLGIHSGEKVLRILYVAYNCTFVCRSLRCS